MKNISLIGLLDRRALEYGNQSVFSFLSQANLAAVEHLTYSNLRQRAQAIARSLQQYQAFQERVLLIYRPGLDFIAAFWGCLYAGAIAVPAYPPRKNHHFERLQTILQDAQAKFVLTTAQGLDLFTQQDQDWTGLADAQWITTDTLDLDLGQAWTEPELQADDLALLQYTSGSTSQPKGVMIQHRHL